PGIVLWKSAARQSSCGNPSSRIAASNAPRGTSGDVTSEAIDMGTDAGPPLALPAPDVRVAAASRLAVRPGEGGARMNEGEVAQEADAHVLLAQLAYRRATADLGEELRAIEQRAIRVHVHEVGREVLLEPCGAGFVDRAHVLVIELGEDANLRVVVRLV